MALSRRYFVCRTLGLSNQVVAVVYAWSPDSQYFSQSAMSNVRLAKKSERRYAAATASESRCARACSHTSKG